MTEVQQKPRTEDAMAERMARRQKEQQRIARLRRKKRKRKERMYRLLTLLALFMIIIAVILIIRGCTSEDKNQNLFLGRWQIDEVTGYEFGEEGSGALVLPTNRYAFSYTYDDKSVKIVFVEGTAKDTEFYYTFSNKGAKLVLSGVEGTNIGTVELSRVEK